MMQVFMVDIVVVLVVYNRYYPLLTVNIDY